ncbi:ABC transporter substrate-binding protein [Frankia sp. Cas3]|uniref:ABC transporter substrate-binding protein n=1 Tax=Frankia sp. Cas3 TaxID=3073926 RepID=UPI002AD59C95|nr:ABC transporter substrate-binding protein [Frankia sp. Cas3]
MASVVSLAVLVAACGSSGGSGSGAAGGAKATASSAASQALLGNVKKAAGAPVSVGFITDGRSSAVDDSVELPAAKAAASYVNDYLGGVAGRPLELVVCQTSNTPAGAADCGNQMVSQKVAAVLLNVSGQGNAVAPPIIAAGIPYVAYQPSSAAELMGKTAFSLTGTSVAIAGGAAKYSQQKGYKSIAVVVIDVPTLRASIDALFKPPFAKAGIAFSASYAAPGSPDLTPLFTSAEQKKPDVYWIIGNPATAVSSLKAMETLGITKPTFVLQQEIDPSVVKAVPDGLAGKLLITTNNVATSDPDYQLFNAILDKYAPASPRNGLAIGGYAVVLGFARGLAGLTGEVTPATIVTGLKSTTNALLPVSGGIPFTCGKSPVTFLPALCSDGSLVTALTKEGNPTSYVKLDPSDLYQQ